MDSFTLTYIGKESEGDVPILKRRCPKKEEKKEEEDGDEEDEEEEGEEKGEEEERKEEKGEEATNTFWSINYTLGPVPSISDVILIFTQALRDEVGLLNEKSRCDQVERCS